VRKAAYVHLSQLRLLAQQHRVRQLSMQQICGLVTGVIGRCLNRSEKQVSEYSEQHTTAYRRATRCSLIPVAPDVESVIVEIADHILKNGLKKMDAT
jgi:hypothetical protein